MQALHPAVWTWPAAPLRAQTAARSRLSSAGAPTLGKVPQVTLGFWIIKIAATTFGETGGDAVSMTLRLGYALSSVLFLAILIATVVAQVRRRSFYPLLYWAVIIATTTAGTTMADFADRSLGIGYVGGSALLAVCLTAVLAVWYRDTGSISAAGITVPRVELFYWAAILASNTLGTALGDFLADSGPGYEGGALLFSAALAVVALAWHARWLPATLSFWAAFILTRPLGATLGDLLTKPHASGGMGLSRIWASAVLAGFIVASILVTAPRPRRRAFD